MSQTEFYRGAEAAAQALADDAAAAPAQRAAVVHAALAPLLAPPTADAWACGRGCDACCHLPVGVTFGEALRLAAAVHDQPALRAQVVAALRATAALAWNQLVGQACPLLAGGACAAYAARPLACRALASRDRSACARALQGPAAVPIDEPAFWRGLGAGDVLAAAEGAAGHRELRAALAAVLAAAPQHQAAAFGAARPAGGEPGS
ncbi:MAG: YkgJ family cysteine cluster protein [Planctomycetes bacterium]|nr:YkgJ family cysteine cluster protein [Planctomycetota bacterium]